MNFTTYLRVAAISCCLFFLGISGEARAAHPNVFLNQSEIDQIKSKIQAGQQPWASAYTKVVADANAGMSGTWSVMTNNGSHVYKTDNPYTSDGVFNPNADRKDYEAAQKVSKAMRALGLAYQISGNTAYADRAISIIRTWCLDPATYMNPFHPGGQSGIELSITMPGLFYGADLIYNYPGWNATEKANFLTWTQSFTNSGRNYRASGNQEGWRIASVAAGAALVDDQAGLNDAFADWKGFMPGNIEATGFMTDKGRTNGLSYSLYALLALTQTAEVARHHGVDLYNYTSNGRSLQLAYDKHVPYCTQQAAWPYKQISGWNDAKKNMSLYEMAYLWNPKQGYLDVINHVGRPMDEIRTMGWVTVSHARGAYPWTVSGGTPATVPASPNGLTTAVQSSTRINLSWTDNSNNESGFKIERRIGAGGYGQIATVGGNVSTYSSTGLTANTTYSYRVRSYNSAGDSGYSNEATATTPGSDPPPGELFSSDIGSPAIAGSASESGGVFTINAGGTDIYGSSDQFHFLYEQMTGDGEIIARVSSITQAHYWSKAGVMMRETLDANSKNAMVLIGAGNEGRFQYRAATSGSTTGTGPAVSKPYWVKLVRSGNTFTGYGSANGTTWTQWGVPATIAMGQTIYVGLAATSHHANQSTTAVMDNVTFPGDLGSGGFNPTAASDVGSPAIAGQTSESGGTYTLLAGGTDIYGSSDQFHYAYQQMSGNGEIIARISGITQAHYWSKAGVMMRETLDASAKNAMVLIGAGNEGRFQYRAATSGSTTGTGPAVSKPFWVRLVRSGNTFTGYGSANGTTWTQWGVPTTIAMSQTIYVGLAATSHHASQATTVVIDNVQFDGN